MKISQVLVVALVVFGIIPPTQVSGLQATVRGTIVDGQTGFPIAGAEIELDDRGTVSTTSDSGRFSLPSLMPGVYKVVFRHPGYRVRVDTLHVDQPGELDVRIPLEPAPFELDPLHVQASISPYLARVGFYERQSSGLSGYYLDQATIERRDPRRFTDLFYSIPGVNMRTRSIGRDLIRFRRATGLSTHPDGCIPDLYIDGFVVGGAPGKPGLESHDVIHPNEIEGIEVYVGAATPINYKSACGVILVWTRRGG